MVLLIKDQASGPLKIRSLCDTLKLSSVGESGVMNSSTRLGIRILLTAVWMTGVVYVAANPRFYAEAIGSQFLWVGLASTAILHLKVRPRWTEMLFLGLVTALLCIVTFRLAGFALHLTPFFAVFGLASLGILGGRSIWAEGKDGKLLFYSFIPSLLFVGFGWLTPPLLQYGEVAHPKVLDLYLYSFDCSLGFQPSFLVGALFAKWPGLQVVSYFFYLAFPVPIAAAYAGQLMRIGQRALPVMLALLYCGPIGAIFYGIFPALGPAHVFQSFPLIALSISQARHLLLEPVALAGYRNAIPSLHMAWVMLAWWYARGLSWWTKGVVLAFVLFTILATLGSGEHYLIDLVVAFPFCLMVQGIFAFSLSWRSVPRVLSALLGLFGVLLWFSLLRFATPLFWISPAIPWALSIGTILGSLLQQRKLVAALTREESRESAPSRVAVASEAGELARS